LVLWTVIQVHIATEQFLKAGFQSHPVLSAEITEFQLEHRVDASQLSTMETELKALRVQVREAVAAAAKAERAAAASTEKAASVSQNLGNLKSVVSAMKKTP